MNKLNIVHLYPHEMNIYGDTGNRLVLQRRLEWRGMKTEISLVGVGDRLPAEADIIIGGGGQDAGQSKVQDDLQKKAVRLRQLAEDGTVMLMVCGMYQLFGRRFVTHEGKEIKGVGILPMETRAQATRLIGNTVYDTKWGKLVGYENHSGLTALDDTLHALGAVVKGAGNNGSDKTEGCRMHNVLGTYSHGPILSKNPQFADALIRLALERKYGSADLKPLDDSLEQSAWTVAIKRPR